MEGTLEKNSLLNIRLENGIVNRTSSIRKP